MDDNVSFLTPQEKRLLSLEERLLHMEKKMTIMMSLLADFNDVISQLDIDRQSKSSLEPLSP